VPRIFRRTELNATCAFACGWAVVGLAAIDAPRPLSIAVGAALGFGLRMLAMRRGWRLPALGPDEA
jgi:uncharacterized membrane protein YeiH